ncbi:MAG: ThiF family adenylyltransferase [Woeseiaceae bacterium]
MNTPFDRYHRQALLNDIGTAGQSRMRDSTVLLLGCGALGSVAADLLSRAGVGHLVIVDRDIVEETNLQRQLLFDEQDVAEGLPKAEAARRRIGEINSQVRVTAIVDDINRTNIARFAEGVDLLLDGLDNLETRYLANDLAVRQGLPYVYGAAVGTTGMAFPVLPHHDNAVAWSTPGGMDYATPCFRCVFEEPPPPGTSPTCDTVGVLGSLITMIVSFQVTEAVKILTGNYDRVCRKLLHVDVWTNEMYQLDIETAYEKGACPCCKGRRFDYLDGTAGSSAAVLCGRDAVQLRPRQDAGPVDLRALAGRLEGHGNVEVNEFLLRAHITDGNKPYEITLFPNGRAIIKGTHESDTARGIYSKYVGT